MTDQYPRITSGLGKMTPELWDRVMASLRFTEQVGPKLQRIAVQRRVPERRADRQVVGLYRVTDSVEVVQYRWEYGWEQAALSGTDFVAVEDGLTHESDGYGRALNIEEANNNTFSTGYGVPVSGPLATIEPLPLVVGSIVPGIIRESEPDTVVRPVFLPATNGLDVACAVQP